MADQGHGADLLWTSEIRLGLLGPVRLTNSAGDDLTPKTRKTRALLALLVLAKSPLTRTRLIDLLWGERGEEQAKASLRQALYELRTLASRGYLIADRQSIGPGPKKLETDVALIQQKVADKDADGLADALDAIECPLLGTLDDLTPELDEWLRDERAQLQSTLVGGALPIAKDALASGKAPAARRIADRLERLDPLDERVAQLGIRADLAAGDRAGAIRRHARLSDRLKDELGIEPSSETTALLGDSKADPSPRLGAASSSPNDPSAAPRARRLAPWLLAFAVAAALAFFAWRSMPAASAPTIAVLPFESIGQKQDYFASGVSDEVLNLLAHQGRLRVLGRITAEQIGERPNSLEVARKLGITHLLDGSVRSAGDRVLVIVRLTRVADGAQLWSERYDRRIGDIFAVQGDIASAVAARLTRSLAPAVQQATSPEVYDRYLAARQLARERREVTLQEAERLLREAIAKDPNYAPAFAELAQVIMLQSDHPTAYGSIPLARARAEAAPFAKRAVQLDPNLGDGYAALGFLSFNLPPASERYFRRAVELSPQRPEFHRWHAATLWNAERYDEAIREYRRAVEIDPLWGLSYDHLIGALYLVGRREEAEQAARRFLSLSTDQRERLLLTVQLQGLDFDLAGELRTARLLQRNFPDERTNRLNLASTLAALGERRAAYELVAYDPLARTVLRSDWPALARAAEALGPTFWDRGGFWNASSLLVASGQSNVLAKLYYRDQPLVRSGQIDLDDLATPEVILALRQTGRGADADSLLARFREHVQLLPDAGLFGQEKSLAEGSIAALRGDRRTALRKLDEWSRREPFYLAHNPAMALRHNPVFAGLADDPGFATIEDRIRQSVNRERIRAGLTPISREAWISDPKSLLTMN